MAPRSTKARSPGSRTGPGDAGAKGKKQNKATTKKRSTSAKANGTCFVISPFGGWHDDYHKEIFCSAIEAVGLVPTRADDLFRSSNIVNDIWQLVSSSRVMLADLTGKNANVFYELGLAHATHKPVLLVTQSLEDVPFDLRALRVIPYDVQHPAWGELLRENIEAGLRETLESPEGSVLPTFLLEEPRSQPKVSAAERRMRSMQQQLDALQAQVRSQASRRLRPKGEIRARDAEILVSQYVTEGMPPNVIVEKLVELGAPEGWVRDEIGRRITRMTP